MEKNIKKYELEQKTTVRITAIILCGIMGSLGVIGAFWGREGYTTLGASILAFSFIAIWMFIIK